MEKYYLHINSEEKGPFTVEQLRAMWNAGEINGRTQFWTKSIDEWRPLETVRGMFEPAKPVSPSPMAAATAAKVAELPPDAEKDWRARMTEVTSVDLYSASKGNRPVQKSFPVLTFVSALMRGLGWIVVCIGVIFVLAALAKMLAQEHLSVDALIVVGPGLVATVSGLALIAYGEIVGVAFSIEENTFKSARSLDDISRALQRIANQQK